MTGTVVLVPRRADGGHRDRLWEWCRSRWSSFGWDIIEGASPPGPFNRAAAINAAAFGDWDVAVIIDSDVVCDVEQVRQAVDLARDTGEMVLAFDTYIGMTPAVTGRILSGHAEPSERPRLVTKPNHESSVVCVSRALWDTVGGFDVRFEGWGQEDVAFAQACRVFSGVRRVPGVVFHLYHPRSPEKRRGLAGYKANQDLGKAYRTTTDPDDMHRLIRGKTLGRSESFARIWERNDWNGDETLAGPGSGTIATRGLRDRLPAMLEELGVGSVLDAGCAESYWQPDLPGYIGVDIIPAAIESARLRYPDRDFRVLDIVRDDLPRCDAVLCRDVLQHLPLVDALAALNNFRRSGAKWLVASTHVGDVNHNVLPGRWYPCNLEAEPFLLGPPVRSFADGKWKTGDRFPNKRIGVWEL